MAFVKKAGSKFQVRQGNNNKKLSTYKSKDKADEEVRKLHKEYNPQKVNRGKNAARKFK